MSAPGTAQAYGDLSAFLAARRAIDRADTHALAQLIAAQPALIDARDPTGTTLLGHALEPFSATGDDPAREQRFTRRDCSLWLLDHGAQVYDALWQNLLAMRAVGPLSLLATRSERIRSAPALPANQPTEARPSALG